MRAIRILHLEDDPADARLIFEHLRRAGLSVDITPSRSREQFVDALASGGIDIVLSDFHVPSFNGGEALKVVREALPQMPFILVTGALGDERAVDLLRSGATDYVLKDRLARLAPAIQRALTDSEARHRHDETQARLADANRLSKLAAAAGRMGTWHFDKQSGKLDCSDEFLTLLGVQREAWGATREAFESLVHPEDAGLLHEALSEAVRNGSFIEFEFRVPQPTGETRWMHIRGDCSGANAGLPYSCLGVMIEITERKQMEEALRESDRRKDEFLATLAHEIRNPLAPIHNGLSVLRNPVLSPSEAEPIHAMLDRQMKHIIRLVDDLLDVSRYTLGKIELKLADVELQSIVRNAVEMSQPLIDSSRHTLDVSVPLDPVMLHADGVRLAQVLSNLLNNAAKYTRESGRLWLNARQEGEWVVISVRDSGVGIPEKMLDRVFDLFTQINEPEAPGNIGLGIGLAMVKMLVGMHGGEVEARSAGFGAGSEFIVRLPCSTAQAPAVADGRRRAAGKALSGRRILVVDDNCDSADSLGMLMRMGGADVRVAYDGPSALGVVSEFLPHFVLLDIGMPGMDGYTVAAQMRRAVPSNDMKLVALTGFGQERDRERAIEAGFDHHVTKPADPVALQALLVEAGSVQRMAAPGIRR